MKTIFLTLALVFFAGSAYSQLNAVIYTDTTLAGQITEAQSAAALARGFTGFYELKSDANNYINRYLQFRFRGKTSAAGLAANSFTTDSVKVQGLLAKKTATGLKLDTVWVDVPMTYQLRSAINVAQGTVAQRDTTCIWISAGQAGVGNTNGYITPIMKLPNYYQTYRVVNATKDSGRVVIREIHEPYR